MVYVDALVRANGLCPPMGARDRAEDASDGAPQLVADYPMGRLVGSWAPRLKGLEGHSQPIEAKVREVDHVVLGVLAGTGAGPGTRAGADGPDIFVPAEAPEAGRVVPLQQGPCLPLCSRRVVPNVTNRRGPI